MASEGIINPEPETGCILRRLRLEILKDSSGVKSAGTSDEQLPLVFRIQINQGPACYEAGLQGLCPVQSGLFSNCEQCLYPSCTESGGEDGELGGHAYSAVGSERSVRCHHPAVPYFVFYGIPAEIMVHAGVFLADHVGVALQYDCRHIFFPFGRLLHDYCIAGCIRMAFKGMGSSK